MSGSSSSVPNESVHELQIIFIYDRFSCQREEDDPGEAILYFHPPEIPEEKRIAICGQLMGVTHFLLDAFSPPKILVLANGKFAIRTFGKQYVLALGCSTATPDWFLDKQADILYQLTRFFHSDIQSVLSRADGDRTLFSKKLTTMMEHYIPISQRNGDMFALTFGILPILYLPKTANGISIQASLILQTCLMKKGVLGGMVMYQNKVVAVELGQDLAQKLAFIQPYRMPPADTVKVDFKLPMGVQLLVVYLTRRDLEELNHNSARFQCPSTTDHRTNYKTSHLKERLGFAINSIREEELSPSDKSSIISVAPFEELRSTQVEVDVINGSFVISPIRETDVEHCQEDFSNKILESSPATKRKFQSLTDNSIAHLSCQHLKTNVPGLNRTCHRCRSNEDLSNFLAEETKGEKEQTYALRKYSSLADPVYPFVRCDGKSVSHFLVNSLAENNSDSEDKETFDSLHSSGSDDELETRFNYSIISPLKHEKLTRPSKLPAVDQINEASTIVTPSVRRPQDLPIAKAGAPIPVKKTSWSLLNDIMSPISPIHSDISDNVALGVNASTGGEKARRHSFAEDDVKNRNTSRYLNTFRKLSSHDDSISYSSSEQEFESKILPVKQNSSDCAKFQFEKTGSLRKTYADVAKSQKNIRKPCINSEETYTRASIFMYCFGTMRLLIVLDPKYEDNLDLINALWGYGSSSIIDLKEAVSNVEEQSQFTNQNDPYCFLRYESVWKSLAHGGRDEVMDFNTVQLMHRDFTSFPNIHELIIRGEDHVVYGYQCVGSEVYYQQSAGLQPGLPMPSDLMGRVPQKAKKRLERDHSILIL